MVLNNNEAKILQKIRENPYISQKELSDFIGLSRPSVANMISGLVSKGYLVGRAYVVNDNRPIVCVGGANIDRIYHVDGDLIRNTSNKVSSHSHPGGVARNIAENLGKLELPTTLLSIVGKDESWRTIQRVSQPYMNLEMVDVLADYTTGNFTEIVNEEGKMILGLAEMDIYNHMTREWLSQYQQYIEKASYIVADTNIPGQTLSMLKSMATRYHIPMHLITTSILKTENLPESIDGIDCVVTKYDETAYHFGIKMETEEEVKEGARKWLEKGAKTVFIVKENKQVVYATQTNGEVQIIKHPHHDLQRYNWGVGEALLAGLIYGTYNERELGESLDFAYANAFYTSLDSYTVRQDLTQQTLEKDLKRYPKNGVKT
ncbi:PfkB family carbohydrate kinase [Lacticigenium naphthae]|uniref:PfkB family carbohydrate kinase n=1 Tax=Lacticigenium naphthae TaxID=515351 RepID=UPI0004105F72|nr:PfkB family carbohydrate kinase [Lacticigenium naphthae]